MKIRRIVAAASAALILLLYILSILFAVIGSPLWGLIAEGPLGYIPVLAIGAVSCAVSVVVGNMALNGAKKLEG